MLRMLVAALVALDDLFKLVLLIAVSVGLLALGRWSSRLGGTPSSGFTNAEPTPDAKDLLPGGKSSSQVWPPSAEEVAASLPCDPALGKIQIKKLYFDKTDVTPGPADAEVFADELNIELYNPDSGHSWWQSFFVATPQGLAKILREKHWRYVYAPEILVLPRYDLEELRRAIVSRIMADQDYVKGNKREHGDEESL